MRYGFDIGGCISKYPQQFKTMMLTLVEEHEVYIITDMHDKAAVLKQLKDNGFEFIPERRVCCADYTNRGELCKAYLLKELGIDIFIDDFMGYLQWDSSFGPAPIRLLVCPDALLPYWDKTWKVDDKSDFGRRVASLNKE
jgi:hypothetical protein